MGRDIPTRPRPCAPGHFNPRAPYGARPAAGAEKQSSLNFNPLARVGRDGTSSSRCKDRRLSIHAPRVGRDDFLALPVREQSTFQSTRPAWGATKYRYIHMFIVDNFNPRAPRGARRKYMYCPDRQGNFNPRAPRGARLLVFSFYRRFMQFQSTRPAWGATRAFPPRHSRLLYFNPRAPRGARHIPYLSNNSILGFQSTRPAWGATNSPSTSIYSPSISIHAPRVGRDDLIFAAYRVRQISIHAPRVGRDRIRASQQGL